MNSHILFLQTLTTNVALKIIIYLKFNNNLKSYVIVCESENVSVLPKG
jgi:hypothetical protein